MPKSTFEWQIGGEGGDWQVIAQVGPPKPARRVPWWVWSVLIGTILILSSVGYVLLRQRVDRLNEQIAFQVQTVIDLEAQAWTRNDVNTYLAQQDDGAPQWYDMQRQWIGNKAAGNAVYTLNTPIQAQVKSVNVQGSVAWVETHEASQPGPVRRMRFYRKTPRGWLHTAPDPAFWGQAIEYHYGDQLILRFHKRDRPYIEPLIETLGKTFYDICYTVGCSPQFQHEINVLNIYYPGQNISANTTILLSPWVSGIPLEGDWGKSQMPGLLRSLAFNVAQAQFQSDTSNRPLTPLQRAILDEYATWMSTHDLAQSPLLGRVIARYGPDILPDLFAHLKASPTQNAFLSRWLALKPPVMAQPAVYFETLLNIEQEAVVVGRTDTFLLLQDDQDSAWISLQLKRFEQTRSQPDVITLTPVQVYDIQMQDNMAVMSINGNPLLHSPTATIFRLREDGWKHNDFVSASYRLRTPTPTPTPRP